MYIQHIRARLTTKTHTAKLAHNKSVTTSYPETQQNELQTCAGDAGAKQVGVLCQAYAGAFGSRKQLTDRREFARNHRPSPQMVDMAPQARASGESGIVISCADPRVPCDKILGFDETIRINIEVISRGNHSNNVL